MTKADQLIEIRNQMLTDHLEENNLTEIDIFGADQRTEEILTELGVSYSTGQFYITAIVPQSWIVESSADACERIFDFVADSDTIPRLLLPSDPILLVVEIHEDHRAKRNKLAELRDLPSVPNERLDDVAFAHHVI